MTLEEFEAGYAERSLVTVEWLHEHNQRGIPCDCGYEFCEGWKMTFDAAPPGITAIATSTGSGQGNFIQVGEE